MKIRDIKPTEIEKAAELFAAAYYDDVFFHWCVPRDADRPKVVKDYYTIYLSSRGAVSHVIENDQGEIIAATVWLPHDADESMYPEIERIAGVNAPQFIAVAEKSHANEPKNQSFYQLVGFGVKKELQGTGFGKAILGHALNIFDKQGIPTYLEASTPFYGGGVYGKFGYTMYSDLMVFTEKAVLYPLYRDAK